MAATEKSAQLEAVKLKGPNKYKVIMLNDDSTPMEFVVQILMQIFKKSAEESTEIMLEIHERGRGVAGTYMYEVAEQKVAETVNSARMSGFPLTATLEES